MADKIQTPGADRYSIEASSDHERRDLNKKFSSHLSQQGTFVADAYCSSRVDSARIYHYAGTTIVHHHLNDSAEGPQIEIFGTDEEAREIAFVDLADHIGLPLKKFT
jgi:hypothetical protein